MADIWSNKGIGEMGFRRGIGFSFRCNYRRWMSHWDQLQNNGLIAGFCKLHIFSGLKDQLAFVKIKYTKRRAAA